MTLRLILGDQLNHRHSWFAEVRPDVTYVLMEILPETAYVRHHVQKVIGFFLAMRHFAAHLEKEGHTVRYFKLDDPKNLQSFEKNVRALINACGATDFQYQLPDEWRVDEILKKLAIDLEKEGIKTAVADTEHFLSSRYDLKAQFEGKKTFLMEAFYRKMRVRYNILMEDDGKTPLYGRWNFDAENRKKMPAGQSVPPVPAFNRDVHDVLVMLQASGVETIGSVETHRFDWPVTREESLELLENFVRFRLGRFGDYQDALTTRHWLLFHSRLSFSLNIKLLHPLEVVQACVAAWLEKPEEKTYASLEGFVRQILGWREYMRGVYWAKMPEYRTLNYFNHTAPLPSFYWNGDTPMRCLSHAVTQSLDRAYAHHIQRLMVTGNFALLLGVHPDELDAWYLGIYMDALEWVEITNTRGMSQFADGGIVGTKPYVSSANYIHKMGDYCTNCAFDKDKKYGENACPFNSLYWDFYDRHRDKLGNNPRIGMMYKVWDKMAAVEREKILEQAAVYKARF
ncbi:MAG: cryptochrome/photolyase family protein [Saprospiraceae bacterium]|nr:cryptochrome/photolyase family protein [Saprospiraceae bacterium]